MLDGIRVLDLSTVGPGSRCAAMLADLGADVVKIGPPPASQRIIPKAHAYSAGRGCRRIGIDLKAGREVFLRLAERADVVIESFRPTVASRLGIDAAAVQARNPKVVYASLTGYGQDGPYAQWAGHDLNYQALAGVLGLQGRRADGGPALPGATFADSAGGGMHAALAICAALVERQETGRGRVLDVSAVDGVLACMALAIDEHLAEHNAPVAGSELLTGRYACYDLYECADGKWLSVGAIEGKFFHNLCRALDLPQLASLQYEHDRQDEVRAALRSAFKTRDRDDWVAELGPADTCVAPVLEVAEVPHDAHVQARGGVVTVQVGDSSFQQLAPTLAGAVLRAPGSAPGSSDAAAVLADAGFELAEVDRLIDQGVVR